MGFQLAPVKPSMGSSAAPFMLHNTCSMGQCVRSSRAQRMGCKQHIPDTSHGSYTWASLLKYVMKCDCACTCMCVCEHVFIYACGYVFVCICQCTCMYILGLYVHDYVSTGIYVCMCVCVRMCMNACGYLLCMYVSVCV